MASTIFAFRRHWLVLAVLAVLLAAVLTFGTLSASSERQPPELRTMPMDNQSFMDATDPGLAADPPEAGAKPEPPEKEPGSGVNQVAPETGRSDALTQWLAEQPETMGFITDEDAITADPDTMDWLLYQAVYKDVLTQEEADAIQDWYDERPSVEEAPELAQYQPAHLEGSANVESLYEALEETQSR